MLGRTSRYPKRGRGVRTYTFYIWDARYTVPSLAFIDAGPDAPVADLARDRLEESHHHLAVEVLDIKFRTNWGWNVQRPLMGTLPEDFPFFRLTHIPIDSNRGVCTMPWGTEIELKPFFGIMGVAPPPEWGQCSSVEPRAFGGNIDNKHFRVGTTVSPVPSRKFSGTVSLSGLCVPATKNPSRRELPVGLLCRLRRLPLFYRLPHSRGGGAGWRFPWIA